MKAKVIKKAATTVTKEAEVKTSVAEPSAIVKTVEEKEVKAPVAKAAVKEPAKKTAAKATAKKTAAKATAKAKKEAGAKTTAAKAAKKTTARKAEVKTSVTLQFYGKSYTQEDLMKIAKDVWKYDLKKKVGDLKSVELYVKPEENICYYVINGDVDGSFAL